MRRVLALGLTTLAMLGSSCGGDGGGTGGDGGGTGPSTCSLNVDCDDSNPCTVGTCKDDGTCSYAPGSDGVAAEQEPGDCARIVCESGEATREIDNGDAPDDGEQCTLDACQNGSPAHLAKVDNTPCQVGLGSGSCLQGQCVVLCDPDSSSLECDDGNGCTADSCEPCTASYCAGMGLCQHASTPGIVPDDGNACTVDSCEEGEEKHAPVAMGAPCSNGGKVCSATGQCVECVTASHCDGPVPTCYQAACNEGICSSVPAPKDTDVPPAEDPAGDCHKTLCNGQGGTKLVIDDTDKADDGNACTVETCTDGSPSLQHAASGTTCGSAGETCDAQGHCCGIFRYTGGDIVGMRHAFAGSLTGRYAAAFDAQDGTWEDLGKLPGSTWSIKYLSADPSTGIVYYATEHEVGVLEECGLPELSPREFPEPTGSVSLSWTRGMAFDGSGQRVLVLSVWGHDLIAWSTASESWSAVSDMPVNEPRSLEVEPVSNKLFVADLTWNQKLYRFTPAGGVDGMVTFDTPISPPASTEMQLKAAGGNLYYVLHAPQNSDTWYQLVRIDPATGVTTVVASQP